MAGLPVAEKIARGALLQILGADREAGAEQIKRGQRGEPLARRLRQLRLKLGQEIGGPARPATADPAPQLVQL